MIEEIRGGMTSRVSSPRRFQSQNSLRKEENGMDSPSHPGRQPLRAIPEVSSSRSSSASEQTESESPCRPPAPRGKKRAAAQSENIDCNIGSASNTPEKPREKRTTLTRASKSAAAWSSKLPVPASLARALQESLLQTDVASKSWDSDSVGGTPTTNYRTPLVPSTGAGKSGLIEQTSRTFKISGKPPLDAEPSRTFFGSSNSSLLQSTPSRSVNRSLRYGATPGSAASVGSSRAPVSGAKSSGSFQFNTGQQILVQQFDLEEDTLFWEDHNVQVILRTRPINASESALKGFSRCIRQENSHSISWIGQPETRFTFDHVAGEHITQESLFRVAGVPMVENCMAGYNSCMFCYGQTGSGKTHTMLGDIVDLEQRPSADRGITPRVFEYLFSKIQKEEESRTEENLKYVCKCSFLEIFNEQITDLLEPSSTNLQVREGGKKGVYVENLSEFPVRSVQDVVHLLLLGAANRKVAATNMNRESSRSHSVFTCTIESKWEFNSATNIRFGRLNLVDLAGSERQKTSGAEGERLREAANINKSLSTLGLVIMILVDVASGKQRHVPYRDSKLTYLLQDSLGGNSKTTMIANISPSSCCALETLSTLKFAQRAKFIRNNAVVNDNASGDVNGLRQEIQELKEELDRIRRKDLPRTPSVHSVTSVAQDSVRTGDNNLGMAVVAVDEQEHSRCSLDAWELSKAFSGPRFSNKKLEAMEAVLAGSLRREQEAEISQKRQSAEIEQLTRLVKQREDGSQCSKMLLRFREDKIRRLEALSAGSMSADVYLRHENDFLMNELRLLQEKADRNPELTRFAMENTRLLEQLRRYQDFYIGGEREAMADEISSLRDQLLEVLDSKLSLTALTSPQREALVPELAASQREIELLRIEADNYRREVEDCRRNLSSILEANSRITRQFDELHAELREVKLKNQDHLGELQKLRERALDAEAIEWGHAQHLELISNLKIKLQQSEERADREASLRFDLNRHLNASLGKATDLQADLQETRGALDAAEMLVSVLQSAESDLSVTQVLNSSIGFSVFNRWSHTKACEERDAAASKLLEHLNEGERALTDAVHEMQGILDDCLSQPTPMDKDRVQEQETIKVQQSDTTNIPTARKDTEKTRLKGGNDHSDDIMKNFSVCTTMLHWFSGTLTAEASVKNSLRIQNDRCEEELVCKNRLISSLQKQLERVIAKLFEKDSMISKLQNDYDEDQARLLNAEAQVATVINEEAKMFKDVNKHRLELTAALKRMDDTELELARMLDVLTKLRAESIGCQRERERLVMEKEQLAAKSAYNGKVLERSCSVSATMVWWLQSKSASDDEAYQLKYDYIASQVGERDRLISSLQNEITEKAMFLKEQLEKEESLIHQNLEHVREAVLAGKEIAEKDSLLIVMQTNVSRLQNQLLLSEGRSTQLAVDKEKLLTQLCELRESHEALQESVSLLQRDLQDAEAKVVELAIAQAGMLIVQEEWGLERDELECNTSEMKQRCSQLEQELELARKLQTVLEASKTQQILKCVENDELVTSLRDELKRTKSSAEDFKEQSQLDHESIIELESRLQKHLAEWKIEKETMSSAAVLANDRLLEKDLAFTAMEACLAALQSQLIDVSSRESKIAHDLEELLLSNESTQRKNEDLVRVVDRQSQEMSSLRLFLELKIQLAEDRLEDTHRHIQAVLGDLDALILMKEKLEVDTESLEEKILHHCYSIEQQLTNANEDKSIMEVLLAEREHELLEELSSVQSENMSFDVRVQALEDALEDTRLVILKKEEDITVLQRDWTESEDKLAKAQEKLRASNFLMKELGRSEEQLKLQTVALAAENKRLTRCMACREMEFSSLQGQVEVLEESLKESHGKERIATVTLGNLKESLKVLERQWRVERDQMKERLFQANRELSDSKEMNQSFCNAMKELEGEIIAAEKKCEATIIELETQWSIARGEMSRHLTRISLDVIEEANCAEKAWSLLSAADAAIEQLVHESSALKDTNKQLFEKQEALQSELSRWEQYSVDLLKGSCFGPSSCNYSTATADSGARPFYNHFEVLKTEVEKLRRECERMRAELSDRDIQLLSVQLELSASIASNREGQIKLACVADERSDLRLQVTSINTALVNAQDEVRCRDVELKSFECELHKVMKVLLRTEEKMDESSLEWRKQVEELKAEIEDAKLRANEKSTEAIILRKQFEDGQATLMEAETLVNALVRANESAKRDVLKWKSREEKITLQSSELLSMIDEEVSITIDHVEKQFQDLTSDINGMKTLLDGISSEAAAGFDREFKEFMKVLISEVERASKEAHLKLAEMNAKAMDLEQRTQQSLTDSEVLQVSLDRTKDLLQTSQAALEDAMQDLEVQHKGHVEARHELQGALASIAGNRAYISELTFERNHLSSRNRELERLFTETCEELRINVAKSIELEIEKLSMVEKTEMLQVENKYLHGQVKQLEMSLAEAMRMKQVVEEEAVILRQQQDAQKDDIRKLELDVASSHDMSNAAAAKLLETEVIIQSLTSDVETSHSEVVCIQRSLDMAVAEVNDLRLLTRELEEKEAHLMTRADTNEALLESTSEKLVQSEAEFREAVEILATMLESTSSELHAAETLKADLEQNNIKFSSLLASLQVTVSQLGQEKEFLSERVDVLEEEKKNLLESLEMQSKQLCVQSLEASAATSAHELQLEILKTIIESTSRSVLENDHMIYVLQEKLEQSTAHCVSLDENEKDLLNRVESQSRALCKQSEEARVTATAHQTELEILRAIMDSVSLELQEKDQMVMSLREKLEHSSARCLILDEVKEHLLKSLEVQSLELSEHSEEANAVSTAHQLELEILGTIINSASNELLEKDHITSSLRDNLLERSAETQKLLKSLEGSMVATAEVEHERDEILAIVMNLETEKGVLREEIIMKSRNCSDLEIEVMRLLTEVQESSTAFCKQKLELEILTTMLESAVQEAGEKDAMASGLNNLLNQSQLQNAEMLQSSQEVVKHFSLFQSQLDSCFQQNKELERNKLELTAEVYSLSQEVAENKELRQSTEKCLDELRTSFTQLERQKDDELRGLRDEVENLMSQEAAMEVDLWDWEQRCQDTEMQLEEKASELMLLRGKFVATQEECKEQLELAYAELQECQRRISQMDSERRDLISEIEEGCSAAADLQAKLQIREIEMEEHFSKHSIEQEALEFLENERRELESSIRHLTAEVAANQQRATTAENLKVETSLELEALARDLKQKDDLLQSLESDLHLLQESALQELRLNQELDSLRVKIDVLQKEVNLHKERRTRLEIENGQVTEEIVQTRNQAASWKAKAHELETELDIKRQTIESLEDELRMAEQNMANTLEEVTVDLKEVETERDRLQVEILELTEQLEMTHSIIEERDAVVSELHQAGELSRNHAKEKEDEAKLLARSVHELESTVYALENQLGLLKREAERQRLLREDVEMESQKLNNHIFVTQSALEESNTRNAQELKDALSALQETERKVEDKESEISHFRRKLENLEITSTDKDIQINDAMAQISDLLLAVEVQKTDYQQKLKRMESQVEQSKTVKLEVQTFDAKPAQELCSRGSITHASCQTRINELEELALSRQKEVFTLHSRLAEAESMTHDVLRDLLGVKSEMSNVVSMLDQQQIKQLAETACRKNVEAEEMETELSNLRSQLNAYIEERECWVQEMSMRQSEVVAARVAAESLRQKEQVLMDEIEKFRIENINHQEKIGELEMEIRKLPSSQQSFCQQINHHAKIKEENHALKLVNEELSKELRRTELLHAGMHDELVQHRSDEPKSTSSSFDEARLNRRHLLQEAENSRAEAAQKLSSLCSALMQAAGLSVPETVDVPGAMDALHLLQNRLRTTELELSDSKYKLKVTGERRRRTDGRSKDSPLRSISNFTDLLQRASSASPAPR